MSGFVGIATGRGGPVDPDLLDKMTGFLAFRGPDRQQFWCGLGVGLGHTLFATTDEAIREVLPCSLDGTTWITADCRIDAREELYPRLEALGCRGVRNATDPELILHAYQAWGDDCVHHLLGDFAFVIWDANRRRMFCARDQFGIKLFYYAMPGHDLVVSNTLNCIRLHAGVSDRWNDTAICDFLMTGMIGSSELTTFADIHCLPPAHIMVFEEGRLALSRYWQLPIEEPIRFRHTRDYVERFHELVEGAVRDRIRTDRLTIQMSGGLDSTLLAATARRVSSANIRARTIVFRSLIQCDELLYAEAAARHIGIPIDFQFADDVAPFEGAAELAARRPQPAHSLAMRMQDDFRAALEPHARISFYGEGPDNLLAYEWRAYLNYLNSQGRYLTAAADLCWSFILQRRIPLAFRSRQLRAHGGVHQLPGFPDWIQPRLVERLHLRERWKDTWSRAPGGHPYHPNGYRSMLSHLWHRIFTEADPGVNGRLLETRHPYLDLRVVGYLLALPVVPWCRRKLIMRLAAASLLPEAVVKREKTPLYQNPYVAHYRKGGLQGLEPPPLGEFSYYVTRWPRVDAGGSLALNLTTTPISLGHWWRGQLLRNTVHSPPHCEPRSDWTIP